MISTKKLLNRETGISRPPHKEDYHGKFQNLQDFGATLKQHYSQAEDSAHSQSYQTFLYKRALFGLSVYSPEEITEMHWNKRNRIEKVHARTQRELNLWKQTVMIEKVNRIFSIFTNSKTVNELMTFTEPDPNFTCTLSFKELGITKDQVVQRLLDVGILPYNFRELTYESKT